MAVRRDRKFEEFKILLTGLRERYEVELVQLFELLSEKEIFIPASVFSESLSTLETVSRYLHENLNISFKKIAELTSRSEKTIWQAYRSSLKKRSEKLKLKDTKYIIPISAIADRRLSNLEAVAYYLKNTYSLRFTEIAQVLHRDQRTVWTVCQRAKKKMQSLQTTDGRQKPGKNI